MMAAVREVFSATEALDQDAAIVELARALGFKRTGSRIRDEVKSALTTATRRHIISRNHGVYGIECRTIDDYTRDELIQTLLAAMGASWWERSDAMRAAARRLGFRRTGSRITRSFKSAINGAIRRRALEYDGEHIRRNR